MNFKDILPGNLPFSKKEQVSEKYFALDIGFKEVTAALWSLSGKHLSVENVSTVTFDSPDNLIEASNQTLDDVLGEAAIEPTKILFGVPDNWLVDENLKDEYLNVLKKLVKELDLSPMAYVSTTHALTHMIQKETGVPPTIILVEIADPVSVTVVKAGKIIGTKILKRSDDLPKDIEKALAGFTGVEVLPSKIAIFSPDPADLERYKEELTSFNWMGSLPFLHLPKVEVLEGDSAIKGVALAGASELNPDVVFSSTPVSQRTENKPSLIHQNIEAPKGEDHELVENAGFVAGDIEEAEKEFPQDAEVPLDDEEYAPGVTPQVPMRSEPTYPEEYEPEVPVFAQTGIGGKVGALFAGLKLRGIKLPHFGGGGSKKFIIPLVVILLLGVAYMFLPKAQVTIFIDPKVLEKDAQVVADPNVTTPDDVNMVIPGKIVETDVMGADKGSATGTKQIGSPAKGTVVIQNKDITSSNSASLAQGTTLQGPNNLNFTLDSSVTIPAPTTTDTGVTWGTTSVSVTAAQIGSDSNLSGGTTLSISGKSSLAAKVDTSGLSGGTSKNVSVVTADDQKKLLAKVDEELRQKAQSSLQDKLSGDQKILSEALDEKINSQVYSKQVGDQASDFTLNLSVHYKGTAYSDNDLKQMVAKLVQTNIPPGYILNLQDTQTQADVSKLESDGKLIFLARFQAKLMPKLDTDQIKEQIKGKSPDEAVNILKKIENVIDVTVDITPKIPNKIARIPLLPQNITINVTAK